jgi:hypothetical protein
MRHVKVSEVWKQTANFLEMSLHSEVERELAFG